MIVNIRQAINQYEEDGGTNSHDLVFLLLLLGGVLVD